MTSAKERDNWKDAFDTVPGPPSRPASNLELVSTEGESSQVVPLSSEDPAPEGLSRPGKRSTTSTPAAGQRNDVKSNDAKSNDAKGTAKPGQKKSEPAPATKSPQGKPLTAGEEVSAKTRNASFWIPRPVRARLDADCARTGLSLTERCIDAFNANYERLPDLFTSRSRPSGPLTVRRVRRRRASGSDTVQLFLRLLPEEEQVIDEAIAKFDIPSRSVLMTRVLEADLPALQDD